MPEKKLMWKRNKEKEGQLATPLEEPIEPSNHEDMANKASDMNRLHRLTGSRDNRRESEAVENKSSIRRRSSRSALAEKIEGMPTVPDVDDLHHLRHRPC